MLEESILLISFLIHKNLSVCDYHHDVKIQYALRSKHDAEGGKGHPDRITNTSYGTGSAQGIELKIFDAAGRMVKDLSNALLHAPCIMQVSWAGRDDQNRVLPSGVYFVKLTADEYSETRKVLLVR